MSDTRGKQHSPKDAENNEAGKNKPENNNTSDQTAPSTDHLYRKNARLAILNSMEADLEGHYPLLKKYEDELKGKQKLLKPYSKISGDDVQVLTPFAKKKIRREANDLKQKIKAVKTEIKRLEKLLSSIYDGIDDKISRANLRKAAKHDSYHERYSDSIKKRIDDVLEGIPAEKLTALKAEVPKSEFKTGNAIMMKALVNAPRFLHTRVVSNPTAREEYLQHFRGKLTGSNGKSRKK